MFGRLWRVSPILTRTLPVLGRPLKFPNYFPRTSEDLDDLDINDIATDNRPLQGRFKVSVGGEINAELAAEVRSFCSVLRTRTAPLRMLEIERICNTGGMLAHRLFRTPADVESLDLLTETLQPVLLQAKELLETQGDVLKYSHLPIARIIRCVAMLKTQDSELVRAALAAARNAEPFPRDIAAMTLYGLSRIDPTLRGDISDLIEKLGSVLEAEFGLLTSDNRSRIFKSLAELGDTQRALRVMPQVMSDVRADILPSEGLAAAAVSAVLINSPECIDFINAIVVQAARRRHTLTRTSNQRIVMSFVSINSSFQFPLADGSPNPVFLAACHPLPLPGSCPVALSVLDLLSEMLHRNNVGPVEARLVPWVMSKMRLRGEDLLRRLVAILLEERPDFHFYQFEKEAHFFTWEWTWVAWGYAEHRYATEESICVQPTGITRSEEILCTRLKSEQILAPMFTQKPEVRLMLAFAFTVLQQDVPEFYENIRKLAEEPLSARELGMATYVLGRQGGVPPALLAQAIERIDELSSREIGLTLVGLERQPADAETFARAARHTVLRRIGQPGFPPPALNEAALIARHTPKTEDVGQFARLVSNLLTRPPGSEDITRRAYEVLIDAFKRWDLLDDLNQRRIGRGALLLRNGIFVDLAPHVDVRGYDIDLAMCILKRCNDNKIRPYRVLYDQGAKDIATALTQHLQKTGRKFKLTEQTITVFD